MLTVVARERRGGPTVKPLAAAKVRGILLVQQLVPLACADRDSLDMFARLLQRNARELAVSLRQRFKIWIARPLASPPPPTVPKDARGQTITDGMAGLWRAFVTRRPGKASNARRAISFPVGVGTVPRSLGILHSPPRTIMGSAEYLLRFNTRLSAIATCSANGGTCYSEPLRQRAMPLS